MVLRSLAEILLHLESTTVWNLGRAHATHAATLLVFIASGLTGLYLQTGKILLEQSLFAGKNSAGWSLSMFYCRIEPCCKLILQSDNSCLYRTDSIFVC